MKQTRSGQPRLASWALRRERGGRRLLKLMLGISLGIGQPLGEALLVPITLFYLLTSPEARAASREFLGRALDRPARTADVWRHFHCFASTILDRAILLAGRGERFQIDVRGLADLETALHAGRGAILLGAHVGSFEVLHSLAARAPVPVRALMFRANAGALAETFTQLNPSHADAIIDIGAPGAMLAVQEALARGEIVCILADRSPGPGRSVSVPFLGVPARFPGGPFVLAATLGAPVLLCWGLRLGRRRYEIRFESFAEWLVLPRADRAAALAATIGHYAARLAAVAVSHPYNWFNFYPFWEGAGDDPSPSPPRTAHACLHPAGGTGGGGPGLARGA